MDDIKKLNSSFFSGSSIQPEITSRIASQENSKRAMEDTQLEESNVDINQQPTPYKTAPMRIASQENTKRAVQYTESNQPKQISFSDAVGQAKAAIANLNPNAIKGMNQADAIKYTKNSIADLETKMAQVANLSSMADSSKVQNNPNQAPIVAPNTQVSNNVSNVTNITSDYLRNITASYRTTPQWRDLQG
jgi:hypothetical protein